MPAVAAVAADLRIAIRSGAAVAPAADDARLIEAALALKWTGSHWSSKHGSEVTITTASWDAFRALVRSRAVPPAAPESEAK